VKVGVDACIVSFQKKAVSGIYLVLLLLRREETDRQTDRQGTSFLGRCNCPLLSSAAPFLSASLPPSLLLPPGHDMRNLSGHRSLQRFRRSPSPRHLFHLQPLSLPRFGCCQISLKEASSRTANGNTTAVFSSPPRRKEFPLPICRRALPIVPLCSLY
jgi:hypothetical protein